MNLTKVMKAVEQLDKQAKSKKDESAWKQIKEALKINQLK